MTRWLVQLCAMGLRIWRWLLSWLHRRTYARRWTHRDAAAAPRKVFAQPQPQWVKKEIICLKALMPQAGCRTIAHHFNRRWKSRRGMTVSKTYVADICRKQQYQILHARRQLKHRVPRPMRRNRVWGCDLLVKTDRQGQSHLALAILDHASRACLRLQRLSDKSSLTLFGELIDVVKRYGRPQFLRTDNEVVLVSRLFRLGLWLLGIRQQRIQPGCPWQNGRVERFIGTVKRELATESIADEQALTKPLSEIRTWYNHERPHDHLQGRTPAEVWAGIDVFAAKPGQGQRDKR
ncbi:MAG: transposase [Nitrospiraceae bacterium]|nr:MAG: transposase [Nitrospiraceae bacterium]